MVSVGVGKCEPLSTYLWMDIQAPCRELGLIGVENDIKEEPNGTCLPMESFKWKEVNLTNTPSYTNKQKNCHI